MNGHRVRRRTALAAVAGVALLGSGACTPGSGNSRPAPPGDGSGGPVEALTGLNRGLAFLESKLPLPPKFTALLPIPRVPAPRRSGETDYYSIRQSAAVAEIVPGHRTPIWGYEGVFPGPTIVSVSGRRVVVNHRNELPVPTVVHLYGGRAPADQDGYPTDYLLPAGMTSAPVPSMAGMPGMTPGFIRSAATTSPRRVEATAKTGDTELWTIRSDAQHPVHLHVAGVQVVARNGAAPGPLDAGWKDTVLVGPDDTVQLAVRFEGDPGRYMLHCHNLEHEDMAMMANFRINP